MATLSQKGSQNGSRTSQMSETRRQRLVEIQKREQLKGMLVSKFKLKYGDKPMLNQYIDKEVQRFLANDRLTENNLKDLDGKIQKEAENRDKKSAILDDRKSQRSYSAHSQVSRRSNLSQKSKGLSAIGLTALDAQNRRNGGTVSVGRRSYASSAISRKTEAYSEINENDEWVAIQKFNTLLHYEEQKQQLLREAERKRLIKEELDKQILCKQQRHENENKENRMYDDMHEEHGKLLEQREKDKAKAVKDKIMNDKAARDQQLKDEKRRKKLEDRENMNQEQEYISRLRQEMEAERSLQQEKRKQEREYLQKMLMENEKNKQRQKEEEERQRVEDLKAQDEYQRMLEKQEGDRLNEMKQREQRAQDFMNKMADNVLKKMEQKQKFEDDMLTRYENEKEMRQRQMEERRAARLKNDQEKMRTFLTAQMMEKQDRERADKDNINQQAQMWDLDKKNYDEEEMRLKERIGRINQDNAQYLLKQMATKNSRSNKMHPNEYAINKPLLRTVNQKFKGMSDYNGSVQSHDQQVL